MLLCKINILVVETVVKKSNHNKKHQKKNCSMRPRFDWAKINRVH